MIGRLAILGGSSVYTPELIQSLISHNLLVNEVVLFGRTVEKLRVVADFCQRIVDRRGYLTKIIASTDLEESVKDAEFVLNHIRVGGMRARIRDEKLPPKQGMIGDESIGAGGVANALRTLPTVLDFAERIQSINPNCVFINLTNPMGIVVEALTRYTKLQVIGVCDLPVIYVKKVAQVLHRRPEELTVNYIGLNHFGWIQDVKVDGVSCLGKVLEVLDKDRSDGFDYDVIDLFRMIPTKTVSLYFHGDTILKSQKARAKFRGEVLYEAEQQILKLYADKSLHEIPGLTRERNALWYEDAIVPIMLALQKPEPTPLILCVRNGGAIRDLPADCSVEVPVEVGSQGVQARKVGNCPLFLKGLFESVKQSDRLAVEAVRHKSYEYALQALAIHPLVPSLEAARRFLDRVVKDEKLALL